MLCACMHVLDGIYHACCTVQVGWDESKLDMEDLRMKVIFAKSMKNVYIARKASKEAARVETAVDGKLWEPAQPPLVVSQTLH